MAEDTRLIDTGIVEVHSEGMAHTVKRTIILIIGTGYVSAYHYEAFIGNDIIFHADIQIGHACRYHGSKHSQALGI